MQPIILSGLLRHSNLTDAINILVSSPCTNPTEYDHTQITCAIFEVHLVVMIMALENSIVQDPKN